MTLEEQIRDALRNVIDPELGMNVVDLGLIRDIHINDGAVRIAMVLTVPFCPLTGYLVAQVQQAVEGVPGVEQTEVVLLDEAWEPPF